MIVICDVDETILDNHHRQHLLGDGPRKNWDAFLHPDAVAKDTPIPKAKEGLQHLVAAGGQIVFLTGRNERLREVTLFSLRTHFGISPPPEHLIMRPDGEITKATEFKGRVLQQLRNRYIVRPFVYIDDDAYMWPVAARYGVVLRAPHCWEHLNPSRADLPAEIAWRK